MSAISPYRVSPAGTVRSVRMLRFRAFVVKEC
jgi:hypothetical protein